MKVVFVLGAGASVADVVTKPRKDRPPLDREFFRTAKHAADVTGYSAGIRRIAAVRSYMNETYGVDIMSGASDSLEGVMARLYPDLYNRRLERQAMSAFRALLALFNDRLATTTNDLRPTQKRYLYRMLSRTLSGGASPNDITIITFNQDLQIEKTLELLASAARWKPMANELFCFPHFYGIPSSTWASITGPTGSKDESRVFQRQENSRPCLSLLKLHGSLNWYSTHRSPSPSRSAMFKSDRRLSVTRRRTIDPAMTVKGPNRSEYTLPVIVPPVTHKSSVLPDALGPVWANAEQRLIDADRVIIFGYSCPPLDFESANLLVRAQQRRDPSAELAIIDPNPGIASRYIELLSPARLGYYADAKAFLAGLPA